MGEISQDTQDVDFVSLSWYSEGILIFEVAWYSASRQNCKMCWWIFAFLLCESTPVNLPWWNNQHLTSYVLRYRLGTVGFRSPIGGTVRCSTHVLAKKHQPVLHVYFVISPFLEHDWLSYCPTNHPLFLSVQIYPYIFPWPSEMEMDLVVSCCPPVDGFEKIISGVPPSCKLVYKPHSHPLTIVI